MPVQPEPILDIVRGLSTVASFAIVVGQLQSLYAEFFVSVCDHCRGTGCVTCPHCHGSKSVRARPAFIRARDLAVVDNPADVLACFHCGPPTPFDFNPMAPDDENTALKVGENLKAAVANLWPRPFELGALAGTVACPACRGAPRVRRLTPNFARALGMEEAWDFAVAKRLGAKALLPPRGPGAAARAAAAGAPPGRRLFRELPHAPPVPVELPPPAPKKAVADKAGAAEGDGFRVSHTSAFSLDDYVLNYPSDDELPPPADK